MAEQDKILVDISFIYLFISLDLFCRPAAS